MFGKNVLTNPCGGGGDNNRKGVFCSFGLTKISTLKGKHFMKHFYRKLALLLSLTTILSSFVGVFSFAGAEGTENGNEETIQACTHADATFLGTVFLDGTDGKIAGDFSYKNTQVPADVYCCTECNETFALKYKDAQSTSATSKDGSSYCVDGISSGNTVDMTYGVYTDEAYVVDGDAVLEGGAWIDFTVAITKKHSAQTDKTALSLTSESGSYALLTYKTDGSLAAFGGTETVLTSDKFAANKAYRFLIGLGCDENGNAEIDVFLDGQLAASKKTADLKNVLDGENVQLGFFGTETSSGKASVYGALWIHKRGFAARNTAGVEILEYNTNMVFTDYVQAEYRTSLYSDGGYDLAGKITQNAYDIQMNIGTVSVGTLLEISQYGTLLTLDADGTLKTAGTSGKGGSVSAGSNIALVVDTAKKVYSVCLDGVPLSFGGEKYIDLPSATQTQTFKVNVGQTVEKVTVNEVPQGVPVYWGDQYRKNVDENTFSVRIIAGVNDVYVENVGFDVEVTAVLDNGTTKSGQQVSKTTNTVYSSFVASGEKHYYYETDKGDCFMLLTIDDIPMDAGTYTFSVKTTQTKDGKKSSSSTTKVVYKVDKQGNITAVDNNTAPNAPTELKINKLSEAFGIEGTPLMSWIVNDTDKNEKQTAYQIKVAKDQAMTNVVWDSGKVMSNKNTDVEYGGSTLDDNSLYYWTVSTWDSKDAQSKWSTPQVFSTAVGSTWNATSIWGAGDLNEFDELPAQITYDVDFAFDPFSENSNEKTLMFAFAAQNGKVNVLNEYYYILQIMLTASGNLEVYLEQYHSYDPAKTCIEKKTVAVTGTGSENFKLTVSKKGVVLSATLTVNGVNLGSCTLSDSEGANELPVNFGVRQTANAMCYVDKISLTRQDGMLLYENDFGEGAVSPFGSSATIKDGYLVIPTALRTCFVIGDGSLLEIPFISYDVDFKFNENVSNEFTFTFNQQTEGTVNESNLVDFFAVMINPTTDNKGVKIEPSFRSDVTHVVFVRDTEKNITLSTDETYDLREIKHNLKVVTYKTSEKVYAKIYFDQKYIMECDLTALASKKLSEVTLKPNFGVRQGFSYSCSVDGIKVLGTGGLALYESDFDNEDEEAPFGTVSNGYLNISKGLRTAYHINTEKFSSGTYIHEFTVNIENNALQYAFDRRQNGDFYSLWFSVSPTSGDDVKLWKWFADGSSSPCEGGRIGGIESGKDYQLRIVAYDNKVEVYCKKPDAGYYNLVHTATLKDGDVHNSTFGTRQGANDSAYIDDLSVLAVTATDDGYTAREIFRGDFSDGNIPLTSTQNVSISNGRLKFGKGARGFNKKEVNIAFLRKEIQLDAAKTVEKAIVSAIALSRYGTSQYTFKLYVNGEVVGLGSPKKVSSSDLELYSTFDVTDYLTDDGENCIGAVVYANNDKRFAMQMTVYYTDGSTNVIYSDDTWKTLDGTRAYGDNGTYLNNKNYSAMTENFDMRYFPAGWSLVGFDDSNWTAPVVGEKIEKLSSSPISNMYQYEMPTMTVSNTESGGAYTSLITLDKEIVGGLRLTLPASTMASGTVLTVKFGEELKDGHVKDMNTGNNYTEYWTLTDGEQVIESFGMKCFRYVEISNLPLELSTDDVVGVAYRQAFDETESSFTSSDELLNSIYALTKYSMQATNQDIYTDSQSRERADNNSGDVYINLKTSHVVSNDYTLALHTVDYISDTDTSIMEYNVISIMCAWELYMYTGDFTLIEKNYDDFIRKFGGWNQKLRLDANGLYYVNYSDWATRYECVDVLIDWFPMERDNYNTMDSYYNTVVNTYQYKALTTLVDMAELLGKTDDAESYRTKAEALKSAIKKYFYDGDTGLFYDGITEDDTPVNSRNNGGSLDGGKKSVPATLYPLLFGIIDKESAEYAEAVKAVADCGITGSVYGAQFLWELLYDAELGDEAYSLLVKKCNHTTDNDMRSYDHMINCLGATITTEAWDVTHKNNMTFSHPWGSAGGNAIVEGLCGITPLTAGFEQIKIKPQMGDLEWFDVTLPTVKGAVKLKAENGEDAFEMKVTVPTNTTAEVYLPVKGGDGVVVSADGMVLAQSEYEISGSYIVIKNVGSGEHNFTVEFGK